MTGVRPLSRRFFARDAVELARALLGRLFVHETRAGRVVGRIVETEAYDETDAASHCYRGRTARNAVMFGPAGHAYVYRSYGIHWCFNVTAGRAGWGAAVLVRAVEPVFGIELMARRRRMVGRPARDLARGPGRLTEAMGITGDHDGVDLTSGSLFIGGRAGDLEVVTTPRVGITKAMDLRWRFVVAGNRFVSGPVVP